MSSQPVLIKAIRSGKLAEVRAALDAGAEVELADGQGDPGLPMGIACFMGFVDIVRELVGRGAAVNLPDNRAPTSPLSMAMRGGRTEVVRALIELGAELPAGVNCGLSEPEIQLAQLKALGDGRLLDGQQGSEAVPEIEEIQAFGCFGTDTQVLEADVMRRLREGR
ncbi:MAG: ankyrin repeat domain-containing protein [Dechloromonas sp.]|nr:ankyrin repeat domain-containing protein [Dechloromonas sp.]